jgi:hypothetical protein
MVVADNELIDDAYAWISIEIFLEQQWTAGGAPPVMSCPRWPLGLGLGSISAELDHSK